jgi:hypothetical protein
MGRTVLIAILYRRVSFSQGISISATTRELVLSSPRTVIKGRHSLQYLSSHRLLALSLLSTLIGSSRPLWANASRLHTRRIALPPDSAIRHPPHPHRNTTTITTPPLDPSNSAAKPSADHARPLLWQTSHLNRVSSHTIPPQTVLLSHFREEEQAHRLDIFGQPTTSRPYICLCR